MIDERTVAKAITFGAGMCQELLAKHSKAGAAPAPFDFEAKVNGVPEADVIVIVQIRPKP